ncbi:hypothetical protein B0H13DRAFT_2458174 [Mycena leptocephala]|nr:hypothetical protein B0H13DRAFT_2458174 [Mycena leptocephala]
MPRPGRQARNVHSVLSAHEHSTPAPAPHPPTIVRLRHVNPLPTYTRATRSYFFGLCAAPTNRAPPQRGRSGPGAAASPQDHPPRSTRSDGEVGTVVAQGKAWLGILGAKAYESRSEGDDLALAIPESKYIHIRCRMRQGNCTLAAGIHKYRTGNRAREAPAADDQQRGERWERSHRLLFSMAAGVGRAATVRIDIWCQEALQPRVTSQIGVLPLELPTSRSAVCEGVVVRLERDRALLSSAEYTPRAGTTCVRVVKRNGWSLPASVRRNISDELNEDPVICCTSLLGYGPRFALKSLCFAAFIYYSSLSFIRYTPNRETSGRRPPTGRPLSDRKDQRETTPPLDDHPPDPKDLWEMTPPQDDHLQRRTGGDDPPPDDHLYPDPKDQWETTPPLDDHL